MKINSIILSLSILTSILRPGNARADIPLRFETVSEVSFGKGDFAPYYMVSNQHGVPSIRPNSGYLRPSLFKYVEKEKKFDYGFGADVVASYQNVSPFWIQQLYGELKYRSLRLTAGSKQYNALFRNQELSSGGTVWSGNARPIPQVRLAIPEFQPIPYTNGWVQIKGDVAYGKFLGDKWLRKNYNYQNWFMTTDVWYHQKSLFFRSKEEMPFVLTVGGEFAAQFGGNQNWYWQGNLFSTIENKVSLKDFLTVLIPGEGGANATVGDRAYYYGNHLGAWHAIGEYRLKSGETLKGYFEWFFEDGSGIGKMNGWDGLWGAEFNSNRESLVSAFLVEYFQSTNQGGPIHFAPGDYPDTEITTEATGADDYYNNYFYNGWTQSGLNLGSPMIKSTIYNKDGYLRITDNRIKGVHMGIKGFITPTLSYRMLGSYRESWGTPFIPSLTIETNFSAFFELNYRFERFKHFKVSGSFAFDHGDLYGNNLGGRVGISYNLSGF